MCIFQNHDIQEGLIGAAKSTNALILTGGCNTGAMKLVGDAVRDGQYMVQVCNHPTFLYLFTAIKKDPYQYK